MSAEVTIQVTGGGAAPGIVIDGTADICQASRPIKDDERKAQIQEERWSSKLLSHRCAGIYVNRDNSVRLTPRPKRFFTADHGLKEVGGNRDTLFFT
jgi:hypothetical protein